MGEKKESYLQAAYYFREGECVDQDINEAVRLYQTVLNKEPDNERALYGLAWCYYDEEHPTVDTHKWLPLFIKAAQRGHKNSQHTLGVYYTDIHDYRNALDWLQMSADQDNTDSIYFIQYIVFELDGSMYMDYSAALRYLNRAYELKADYAAKCLGRIYYTFDKAGIQDYKKALRFNQEAAVNGDSMAAFYVAESYHFGRGVERNIFESICWFRFAYYLGEKNALCNLAYLYSKADEMNRISDPNEKNKILEEVSQISFVYAAERMEHAELGKDSAPDHEKAYYYAKKSDELAKLSNQPARAEEELADIIILRQSHFEKALYEWHMANDTDIPAKMAAISSFEKNIEEYGDLNSLRTLVCLYAGIVGFPRFDCRYSNTIVTKLLPADLLVNSISSVVNYRRSFELIDKGIEWGDELCRTLCKGLCRVIQSQMR